MRYIKTSLFFAMAGGLLRYWTALDEGTSGAAIAYLGLAGTTLLLEGAFLGGIAGYVVAWVWGALMRDAYDGPRSDDMGHHRSREPYEAFSFSRTRGAQPTEDVSRRSKFSEEASHRQAPRPKERPRPPHPVVWVRKE